MSNSDSDTLATKRRQASRCPTRWSLTFKKLLMTHVTCACVAAPFVRSVMSQWLHTDVECSSCTLCAPATDKSADKNLPSMLEQQAPRARIQHIKRMSRALTISLHRAREAHRRPLLF
eukprot:6214385-Pleurochrysis_carterae.AAC.1